MQITEKRVHLVFKTHLDIGFTDHAEKVRRQYHELFVLQPIETGAHFSAENPEEPKFISALEQAIERGFIRRHGLPFTTHTELMSPALFRAGLSYSQESSTAVSAGRRLRRR